jgi:lysine 6-dehydrogenase
MGYRYAIVGSGRQGTAAAYDLARFGKADRLLMTDVDLNATQAASSRFGFVSATPYFTNLGLTRAAIATGTGMTDLGGNSDIVFSQLALSEEAASAGATVVPDCGQVPGMGTSLIQYAMEQLDEPRDIFMWDGGLPINPQPPWNYALTFSIEGLSNEYYGACHYIRDGKMVSVPALEEFETLDFPEPIGTLEAFTTSGGLTTAAKTFAGKLRTLQNKTLRYPGHFDQIKHFQQLGLFELDPIRVDGVQVAPRGVLHALWDPQIRATEKTRDFILIHILAQGLKDGIETKVNVDLLHHYDEETGFTAMEQGTGWHAAIFSGAIARGEVGHGVIPIENAMTGTDFVAQAKQRGFEVKMEVRAA